MLRRVKDLYGMPLKVFLSSDDSGSILEEIKSLGPDLFESSSWHYLNYPLDTFVHDGLAVEFQPSEKSALIGETAVLDMWHLSHSQLLIGSLGSRFEKGAYLLAVSRHNVPIPYISVDGHNYCCENDEQCSRATAALTGMVDCMTFAPEMFHYNGNAAGKYWEEGVTIRWDRPVSQRRPAWWSVPWGRFRLQPRAGFSWLQIRESPS